MAAMKELQITLHENLDALGFREWLRDELHRAMGLEDEFREADPLGFQHVCEVHRQRGKQSVLIGVAEKLGIDVSDLVDQ
jgi:hypothetical protein